MSDVSKPSPCGIAFQEVPALQSEVPEVARTKMRALQRALADKDTYKTLCVRDTTPILTRAVKRLVAKAAPGKTYEFKSGYLSGRPTHRELSFAEQLEGLRTLLQLPHMQAPFTLYVYLGERDQAAPAVRDLITLVNEQRPDVKLVIGRGPYWPSRAEFTKDAFELRQLPWNLHNEALALMVAKSGFPVRPQDAFFWMARVDRDDVKRVLEHAKVILQRKGGPTFPEDAELALAEAVRRLRDESDRNDAAPDIQCVVPDADRPDAPTRAQAARQRLRAAIDDLNSPRDPFGGVALCRVENPAVNDAVPQLIDACTDLPVYHVANLDVFSYENDVDLRGFLLRLTRALRAALTSSPAAFYLPLRYASGPMLRNVCDALHAVDPQLKVILGTGMDRAPDDTEMEWFDFTTLGAESPLTVRNKRLLTNSGLDISPARGSELLKPLSAAAAAMAVRQAQVQRRRSVNSGVEDIALLQSAVRTLQAPEEADTAYAEKFLLAPADTRKVKDTVAGVPPSVLKFGELVKHYAQVKKVIPSAAKTLLLKGPPGTGKTATARALAAETGYPLFAPKSSEMVSKWIGESANAVYKLFEQANAYARVHDTTALIFIDEIDAIFKARGGGEGGEREYERITNALLECIQSTADGQYDRVAVIGATNLAHQMDPAALDRFAVKAEIGLPDVPQLKEIFRIHLKGRPNSISEEALAAAAERAYKTRFSGRRVVHALNLAGQLACDDNLANACISNANLEQAVWKASTEALEGEAESAKVRATDYLVRDIPAGTLADNAVGTPQEVQRFLHAVRHYDKLKTVVPNAKLSLLLKGPPGTGKTSIVRGLAAETGYPLFAPKSGALISSMLGASVDKLYKFVDQVRAYATAHNTTAIIFFDEIDALVSQRRSGGSENNRLVNAFLETLEGISKGSDGNVVVIGATNFEHELDSAMLERFSMRIEVPNPTKSALEDILNLHLRGRAHALTAAHVKELAALAHQYHFNGRNIVHALDGAGNLALEKIDANPDLQLTRELVKQGIEAEIKSAGVANTEPPFGIYI